MREEKSKIRLRIKFQKKHSDSKIGQKKYSEKETYISWLLCILMLHHKPLNLLCQTVQQMNPYELDKLTILHCQII